MRAMLDERAKTGSDLPFVNWRYILFKWNDSDEEMGRAREMAKEFGVDRLCWEITDHPEDSFSRRFAPGTPDYELHPPRDLGQQRPRQRDSRRDAARRDLRAHRAARPAVPDAAVDAGGADRARQERVGPAVPRADHAGPPRGSAWRAADRRQGRVDQSRSRARLAAGRSRPRADRRTSGSKSPRRKSPDATR